MIRTCLVLIAVAAGVGSLLDSGASPPASDSQPVLEVAPATAESKSEPEALPGEAVRLRRDGDGHFYATAEINGVPIRLLVDTGASGIALSREDARRVQLPVPAGMFEVVGRGASGDVKGERVVLERVTLGPRTVRDSPAIVLAASSHSLLGQSFLRQFSSVEPRRGDGPALSPGGW